MLVLVGPHASGKTTLGRKISLLLGWHFDEEIGNQLRRQALEENHAAHAQLPQPEFDREVIQKELMRDQQTCDLRIVETWHPGNFAYAESRSPEVVKQFEPLVKKSVERKRKEVLIQPLLINLDTAFKRQREPGPDKDQFIIWLLRVGERAIQIAQEWNLTVAPPIFTDQLSIDEATTTIIKRIRSAHYYSL